MPISRPSREPQRTAWLGRGSGARARGGPRPGPEPGPDPGPAARRVRRRPPPAPAPAAPRPAAAPAAGAPPAAPTGPTVVQVKAEPSQPEWTKVCGKDQGNGAEICYTTRDFVSDQGQPVLAVAVYDVKGAQAQKIVRFLMPLGLLLSAGHPLRRRPGSADRRQLRDLLPERLLRGIAGEGRFHRRGRRRAVRSTSASRTHRAAR